MSSWLTHNASSMGAALAFYTLFSVAPILIIALAIAGHFFGPHTAEKELLAQMQALTGDAGAALGVSFVMTVVLFAMICSRAQSHTRGRRSATHGMAGVESP
jgi:uncharacterized BrkB/YihY/UPF0761 family membrane protein